MSNLLLLFLIMFCISNCKYQAGFMDYFDQVKENLIEEDNEQAISVTDEMYNEDTEDMTYEISVKTDNNDNKMKNHKTKILGPHFLVLSESTKKPVNHPTSNSFSRRQGMMEGIVGDLGTTRK